MHIANSSLLLYGPQRENTFLPNIGYLANNKGPDWPAHPCRLISTFFIHFLESVISKLATSEISIVQLVSVAESCFAGNHEYSFCRVKAHVCFLLLCDHAKRRYFRFENNDDQDQLAQKPADLDPHCFSICKYMLVSAILQVA